jgi:hypothetical protein
MTDIRVPTEYLLACSIPALESVLLSRLSQVAALRREFREVADQWAQSEADAHTATRILADRRIYERPHNENVEYLGLRNPAAGGTESSLLWALAATHVHMASHSCAVAGRIGDRMGGRPLWAALNQYNPRDGGKLLSMISLPVLPKHPQPHYIWGRGCRAPVLFEHAELLRMLYGESRDSFENRANAS